jgi:serine/threonine protein phosphatase PrpC
MMVKQHIDNSKRRSALKTHQEAHRWIRLIIAVLLFMVGITCIAHSGNLATFGGGVILVAVVVLFSTLRPGTSGKEQTNVSRVQMQSINAPTAFTYHSVTEQETAPIAQIIPGREASLQTAEVSIPDMPTMSFMLPQTTDPTDIDATIIRSPLTSRSLRHLAVSSLSHPGIARQFLPNEDNILALQEIDTGEGGAKPAGLFIVADGMGGHARGREASRIAVDTIEAYLPPRLIETQWKGETAQLNLLTESVKQANAAICLWNQANSHMGGSTITALLIVNDRAFVANIGDSRTYLYRGSEGLRQISQDHSIVARLVEAGTISPEEIYTHPKRNQIYRSLGDKEDVEVDTFTVELQERDRLLLCSDGLWEMVHDRDIECLFAQAAIEQASSTLLQAALNNGGADNVSVITVQLNKKGTNTDKHECSPQADATRALLAS